MTGKGKGKEGGLRRAGNGQVWAAATLSQSQSASLRSCHALACTMAGRREGTPILPLPVSSTHFYPVLTQQQSAVQPLRVGPSWARPNPPESLLDSSSNDALPQAPSTLTRSSPDSGCPP
jgi:hypothetical protein